MRSDLISLESICNDQQKFLKKYDLQEAQRLFAASHAANPGDNRTLLQVSDT